MLTPNTIRINWKERGKGSGVWPSMVTHTWNLCSAFNPSKCTHTVVNMHLEQWAANAVAPGEQLGVRCLAQGSLLSRGIEGGESAVNSLPPPTIPAGPEIWTHDLRITSPTLYPLGHDYVILCLLAHGTQYTVSLATFKSKHHWNQL